MQFHVYVKPADGELDQAIGAIQPANKLAFDSFSC